MALVPISLQAIKIVFEELEKNSELPRRVMSLGYPDILADISTLKGIFGNTIADDIVEHPASEEIAKWHASSISVKNVVESRHFFSLFGLELDVVDIATARGGEIIMDLNHPCPEDFHGRYSLVIDAGTIEHCFNVAQAMTNLAKMTCVGGFIFQSNPLNSFNHGFYNFNPTFYYDFYQTNGFSMELFKLVARKNGETIVIDADPYSAFSGVPDKSANFLIAKKNEELDITFPVQTKYKVNPTLGVSPSRVNQSR